MLIKNSFHLIEICINCENDKAHVTHADRNSRAWTEIGIQHDESVTDTVIIFKVYNSSNSELGRKRKNKKSKNEKRTNKNTPFYFNYYMRLWVYILYILLQYY